MYSILYNNITLFVPKRYYNNNLLNRFKTSSYEKEEVNIVNNFFNNKDIVLEIGSCLGYVTSILSKKCDKVISVEANPELTESLLQTKEINNLNNIYLYFGYIDNDRKYINFQTYDNIVAGSGDREDYDINNVRGWGDTQKIYNIQTISLNDIIKTHVDINSLVIDMEGGEYKFLVNNKNFINNNIKKICIELHGHLMKEKNFNNDCLNIIKNMNFKLKHKDGVSFYFEK